MNPTPQQLRREEHEQALYRVSEITSDFVDTLVSIFGSSSTTSSITIQQQQQSSASSSSIKKVGIIPPVFLRRKRDPTRRIRFVDEDEAEAELGQIISTTRTNNCDHETNKSGGNVDDGKPSSPFNSADQSKNNNNKNSASKLPWSIQRHYLHVSQNKDGMNHTTYSTLINPRAAGAEFLTFPSDKCVYPIRLDNEIAIFPHFHHHNRPQNNSHENSSSSRSLHHYHHDSNFGINSVDDAVDASILFPQISCTAEAIKLIAQEMERQSFSSSSRKKYEENQDAAADDDVIINSDFSWLDDALMSSSASSSNNNNTSADEYDKNNSKLSRKFTEMLLCGTLTSEFFIMNNNNTDDAGTPLPIESLPGSPHQQQRPRNKNFQHDTENNNDDSKNHQDAAETNKNNNLEESRAQSNNNNKTSKICDLQIRHPLHRGMTQIFCHFQDDYRSGEPPQKDMDEFPRHLYEKVVTLLQDDDLNDDFLGLSNLIFWNAVNAEVARRDRIENFDGDGKTKKIISDDADGNITNIRQEEHDDENDMPIVSSLLGGDEIFEDMFQLNHNHLHEIAMMEQRRTESGTVAAFEITKILFSRLMAGIKALCGGCFHRRHLSAIQVAIDEAVKEMGIRRRERGRSELIMNNSFLESMHELLAMNNYNNTTSPQDAISGAALFVLLRDAFEVCEKIFCANLDKEKREFEEWKRMKEERKEERRRIRRRQKLLRDHGGELIDEEDDEENNNATVSSIITDDTNNNNNNPGLSQQQLLIRKLQKELKELAEKDKRQTLIQLEVRQKQQQKNSASQEMNDNIAATERNQQFFEKPIWTTVFTEPMFAQDPTLRAEVENAFLFFTHQKNERGTKRNVVEDGNNNNVDDDEQEGNKTADGDEDANNEFDEWLFETTERSKTKYATVPTILQCPLLTLILLFSRPNRWWKKSKQAAKSDDYLWG